MKIYKVEQLIRILEGKEGICNGMTIDEISDKYENFKGSDKSLLRSIVKLFSDMEYTEDYLAVLNELLNDKRVRNIMRKGFGGNWGDTTIKVSTDTTVRTDAVQPTQNEIDMTKSLKWGLMNFKGTIEKQIHAEPPMLKGVPIVTFNRKYIIDGHHRWSQIYCFNKIRNGEPTKFAAINLVNTDLEPIDILKITQTTIGLDLHPEEIEPHVTTENPKNNLLSKQCDEKTLRKFIDKNATDDTVELMTKFHKEDGVKDRNTFIDFVLQNCLEMKDKNNCIEDAPNRGAMPQTDVDNKLLKNIKRTSDVS